jgi:hypothetical protein
MSSLPRLAAFFCVALLLSGCGKGPPASGRDPESAADTFFAALETGDPHAAYASGAFGFQITQTFEAFLSNARELGLVGGQPPSWTGKDFNASQARLDGTLVNAIGKTVTVSVTLTRDDNAWKLFSLRTATDSDYGEQENRFSMVGKGAGFNDVYHQPMPDREHLIALVHETMAKFNTAIQNADFHAFYGYISQQWKDGQRTNGDAAAGVTENMLKNHFQPFHDKKIDLSEVAGLNPVFDEPPLINAQGLLDLSGHFDTSQFRVNFHLEYAYELPRWKVFGIDISLTK